MNYTSFMWLFGLSILLGCCKEPVIEEPDPDPIINQWNITSVIKGGYPNVPESQFVIEDTVDLMGSIVLKDDGTGSITGDIEQVVCNANDFLWMKNDSINRLYLILGESLFTYGIIQKLTKDTLEMDLRDKCLNPPIIGGFHAYRIVMTNQ